MTHFVSPERKECVKKDAFREKVSTGRRDVSLKAMANVDASRAIPARTIIKGDICRHMATVNSPTNDINALAFIFFLFTGGRF